MLKAVQTAGITSPDKEMPVPFRLKVWFSYLSEDGNIGRDFGKSVHELESVRLLLKQSLVQPHVLVNDAKRSEVALPGFISPKIHLCLRIGFQKVGQSSPMIEMVMRNDRHIYLLDTDPQLLCIAAEGFCRAGVKQDLFAIALNMKR